MTEDPDPVVLIVDDEPGVTEMYRLYLNEEYDIRVATSGKEGLEKVDEDVDVVLLDRRMPNVSGDEVLREIRSRDIGCRVVMVTAIDPGLDILSMEFDDYLVKPVTQEELHNAVERMLARDALKEHILEMFALASKLATLEERLDVEELERSERYQQLVDEFAALRDEVRVPHEEEYYSDATLDKFQTLVEERPGRQ